MKNIFRTFLPAVLLMTLLGGSAFAQAKIATVDMIKLFDNYYKTKLAQAALQDHQAQLDKDDKAMRDDLKKPRRATAALRSLIKDRLRSCRPMVG